MEREATFSDNQRMDATYSKRVVDAGMEDIGFGAPVYLQVSVSGEGTGDLTISLQTSDSETMTDAETIVKYMVDSERVEKGGIVLAAPIPCGCSRFMRLEYSGAVGGAVTAGLIEGPQIARDRF